MLATLCTFPNEFALLLALEDNWVLSVPVTLTARCAGNGIQHVVQILCACRVYRHIPQTSAGVTGSERGQVCHKPGWAYAACPVPRLCPGEGGDHGLPWPSHSQCVRVCACLGMCVPSQLCLILCPPEMGASSGSTGVLKSSHGRDQL